ncbi:monovalent cation:proton antiporter-2 (CPA2) family protein [Pendulispora brunnea]|uniref:Monovalent cation:proton antiporter-2 (CPA2) family protein n=1 Tax=Pendulispora brunnea TaxID=2905690 RepID=A0ABZ2JYT8_9BACT
MLVDVAIFLAAAVFVVPISKRLGLGTVIGYLVAGVLIGPCGLRLISRVEETLHFAEFGVVLLLFLIGLELQPARLWKMRGTVFGIGGAQVFATAAALGGAGLLFGVGWRTALVAGLALAMSSTAFALQVLGEKNELARPHGKVAFGILLFQDVAAIPTLALVPMLAGGASEHGPSPGLRALIVLGVMVGLGLAGRYLLRPMLRFIAGAKNHDLSAAATLLVVVGTALLMHAIDLSEALGAFVAGVLLADSEYRHELEANIEPYKGLLLGLFFMAVGMSADMKILLGRPLTVAGLVVGLTAIKFAVLWGVGRLAKLPARGSTSLAVAISQGGEFAFVIFGVAQEGAVLDKAIADLLVVVVTLSMAVTPLLFIVRDRVLARKDAGAAREFDEPSNEGNPVIIAGFGRVGQIVGRVLRAKGIAYTALDASAQHTDFVKRFGNKIYYGDASRPDLLRAAGAEQATLFVLAVDDMETSLTVAKSVLHHFPHLKIIARARNRQHAYALLGLGIDVLSRETFAASLEMSAWALEAVGLTTSEARSAVKRFAEYDDTRMRALYHLRDDEKALIASSKEYAAELQRILDEDANAVN